MTSSNETDTMIFSLLCTPIQFGYNVATLKNNKIPNVFSPCVAYISYFLIGAFYGNCLGTMLAFPPEAIQAMSCFCAHTNLSLYAGNIRKQIKSKYGIEDKCNEYVCHFFCSPCGVCQEALIIEKEPNIDEADILVSAPLLQEFEK